MFRRKTLQSSPTYEELNAIFVSIDDALENEDCILLRFKMDIDAFKLQCKNYKITLSEELQFLTNSNKTILVCDSTHPIRAAQALLKAVTEKEAFNTHRREFEQTASNSKFYPKSRKVAMTIGFTLFMALAVIAAIPTGGGSLLLAAGAAGIILSVFGGSAGVILGCVLAHTGFRPVTKAINASNKISALFASPQERISKKDGTEMKNLKISQPGRKPLATL